MLGASCGGERHRRRVPEGFAILSHSSASRRGQCCSGSLHSEQTAAPPHPRRSWVSSRSAYVTVSSRANTSVASAPARRACVHCSRARAWRSHLLAAPTRAGRDDDLNTHFMVAVCCSHLCVANHCASRRSRCSALRARRTTLVRSCTRSTRDAEAQRQMSDGASHRRLHYMQEPSRQRLSGRAAGHCSSFIRPSMPHLRRRHARSS